MQIIENMPIQLDNRPGMKVYKNGRAKGFSYMVTIPKAYAKEMELDGKSFVTTRLMEEDTEGVDANGVKKKKKVYCIIEKLETD